MAAPACPKIKVPDEYSKLLPRGVPPVERPITSWPVDVNQGKTLGPAEATWYFPIKLGGTYPTGVFLPKGFNHPDEVDVILYFHGNKQGDFSWINQYWHGGLHDIHLREDVNAAGKRAVLVAPTMGENPGYAMQGNADLGIFATPGTASCFLDHVMEWLGHFDPHYSENEVIPTVRRVILAGHSGGGNAIHLQMDGLKAKICEIWCFDVVYGPVKDWVDFAVFNPTKTLTFYWAIQSPDARKKLVQLKADTEAKLGKAIDNLQIMKGADEHFHCLTDNFGNQVKASKCLPKI